MTYPRALPKMTGCVDHIADGFAYCDVYYRDVRYYATIPLEAFGDDAARLRVGSMISRPHRRDSEWGLMPVRPWSEAKERRVWRRAKIRAKELADLLYDHQTG